MPSTSVMIFNDYGLFVRALTEEQAVDYAERHPDEIVFYFLMPYNHEPPTDTVGKYDSLWVYENKDGLRWDTETQWWVTVQSKQFTSWLDHELYEFEQTAEYNQLPPVGRWININES